MRIGKLLLGGLLAITLGLLFLTGVLYAQEPVLKAEPASLALKGGLGADREYSTEFYLVATAEITTPISIVKSSLVSEDGTVRLKSDKITLEPSEITNMAASARRKMTLSVSGVQQPGTYSGKLHFQYGTVAGQNELAVPIELRVAEPTLEIVPGDKELKLKGQVGTDTRFEDGFRLVARGGDLAAVNFDPTDLRCSDSGKEDIPFWKVTMEPATQALSEDKEVTFKLVVTGVDKPGTYTGQLGISKSWSSTQDLTIPIQLTAEATPAVAVVPATAKLDPSLVHCGTVPVLEAAECWLGQWLLGAASRQTTREIRLENTSLASASLQEPELVDVRGQVGGYQLTAEDLDFDMSDLSNGTLPSKKSGILKVTTKANQIPPDEYKGTIRIPVQDQDTPASIEVDLKVREGIFVPLFLVLFGWLLGHLIKLYPNAERRSRLLLRYKDLEEEINKLEDSDYKKGLQRALEPILKHINEDKFDEAKNGLEELEKKLKAGPPDEEGRVGEPPGETPTQALKRWTQEVVGWISGVAPEAEARFILWVVRPVVYFLFVVSIIYLGFQQKYIGQATFGANALADYAAIVTWAMSADIVGRSIANWGKG